MTQTPDAGERFVLRGRTPGRALAIGATCSVLGSLAVVGASALSWPVVVLLVGVVMLAFGVSLAGAAVWLTARLRATVTLDDAGLTIARGRQRRRYAWADITKVSLTGSRLTFVVSGARGNPSVINPGPQSDAVFGSLVAAVERRMDLDRGYGRPPGQRD